MILLNEYKLKDLKVKEVIQSDYLLDVEGFTGEVDILRLPFLEMESFPRLKPKYDTEEINVLYIEKNDEEVTDTHIREILQTYKIGTVNWELSRKTLPMLVRLLFIMKEKPLTLIVKNTDSRYTEEIDKIVNELFSNLIVEGMFNITTVVCNLSVMINALENSDSNVIRFLSNGNISLQLIPDEGGARRAYPTLDCKHNLSIPKLVTLVSGNYPTIYDEIAEAVKTDLWVTDARMVNTDVGRDLDVYGKCLPLETISMRNIDEYLITRDGMYVVSGEVYHIFDDDNGPQLVILDDQKQKLIKVPKDLKVHFLSIQKIPHVEKLSYGNITVINTKNEYIHILLK